MSPDLHQYSDPEDDDGPVDLERAYDDDEEAVSWRVGLLLGAAVVGLGLLALWCLLGRTTP